MTLEIASIVAGIIGAAIGLMSFFAAIMFYLHGNRLNRLSERALTSIDSKVNLIQGQYGKVVDRTFDLAQGSSDALFTRLSDEITTLGQSLKTSIGGVIRGAEKEPSAAASPGAITDIERRIDAIIEERIAAARQEAARIIQISGYTISYEALVQLALRALRHGPVLGEAIQDYMRSHCFNLLRADVDTLLARVENEGLIQKDSELNLKAAGSAKLMNDAFWKLTDAGRNALRESAAERREANKAMDSDEE